VRHVARYEDDLNGVGGDGKDSEDGKKNSPLIRTDISDVATQLASAILWLLNPQR